MTVAVTCVQPCQSCERGRRILAA